MNDFLKTLEASYSDYKEYSLRGRYIHYGDIKLLLKELSATPLGFSEEGKPISSLKIGAGNTKILIWSQMHGNESTGTKSMFDVINALNHLKNPYLNKILTSCTIHYIPILNPDGAKSYTRENARGIDLNRDAVSLKAKESIILRQYLEAVNPDFCFNLHDQRTIFGVEGSQKPATLSFLAPSVDKERTVTKGRIATMNVVSSMFNGIKVFLPNQIGRYTDEFYPTATGDNFQKLGYNTILIESGHYPQDYEREITRKYTTLSILSGLYHIATSTSFTDPESYFEIPKNTKVFWDVIHRYADGISEAYQYKELVRDGNFFLVLEKVKESVENKLPHKEIVFVD